MTQFTDMIDKISDDIWMYVIQHSHDFSWNFLAMKIILTRLNLKIAMCQDNEDIIQECCVELRDLLKKSAHIPNAQKDINKILTIPKTSV